MTDTGWPAPPFAMEWVTITETVPIAIVKTLWWCIGFGSDQTALFCTRSAFGATSRDVFTMAQRTVADIYIPQSGDWVPHWPILTQQGDNVYTQSLLSARSYTQDAWDRGGTHPDRVQYLRLALELPPVWVQKE